MLDADLAQLYGVDTRVLVQAVKRNLSRFPEDFMFQLSTEEFTNLRSQTVIAIAVDACVRRAARVDDTARSAQAAYRIRHARGQAVAIRRID